MCCWAKKEEETTQIDSILNVFRSYLSDDYWSSLTYSIKNGSRYTAAIFNVIPQ
jgi:hypothetical protein